MSKKPISWLELIKLKLNEEKKKGNSPSINDIMPAAKKEWAQIKAGTHPTYMQGKAQTFARKKKADSNKQTRKSAKSSSMKGHSMSIQDLLAQVKMCGKCKKQVEKVLAKQEMTGGYNQFYDVPSVGNGGAAGPGAAGPSAAGPSAAPPGPAAGDFKPYDPNVPEHALVGGGKRKKNKKLKGGCGGTCVTR